MKPYELLAIEVFESIVESMAGFGPVQSDPLHRAHNPKGPPYTTEHPLSSLVRSPIEAHATLLLEWMAVTTSPKFEIHQILLNLEPTCAWASSSSSSDPSFINHGNLCFLYLRSKIDKFLDTSTVFIKMKKPNAAIRDDDDGALTVELTFQNC
ncbi:hypothetical protein Tco_0637364 [Tanacetum coccineum]